MAGAAGSSLEKTAKTSPQPPAGSGPLQGAAWKLAPVLVMRGDPAGSLKAGRWSSG
jgi:hypothetical protein